MARSLKGEMRTAEQVREHYEIEKDLATRLRQSAPEDRLGLYTTVYDELFRRVAHHPILQRKGDPASSRRATLSQYRRVRRFLRPGTRFLEVGPGDCGLAFAVAKEVSQVYVVDVTEEQSHQQRRVKLVVREPQVDGGHKPTLPSSKQ